MNPTNIDLVELFGKAKGVNTLQCTRVINYLYIQKILIFSTTNISKVYKTSSLFIYFFHLSFFFQKGNNSKERESEEKINLVCSLQ